MQPAEFFNQAWAKATTWDRAPHIRQMIDRFNALTRWIATIIVSEEKIRMRVKRFVKFIKIADVQIHNHFDWASFFSHSSSQIENQENIF
jgi:hypothetical protein